MKVAFVLDGIGFGGIEKVAINYVQMFLEMGYDVDIYNLKPKVNDLEEKFPKGCKFIYKPLPDILLPDRYMLLVKRWRWGKYVYPLIYLLTFMAMKIYKLTMRKHSEYDIGVAFSGHIRDLSFVGYNFIKSKKKMCWLHGSLMGFLVLLSTYGDLYRKIGNLCTLSTDSEKRALEFNRFLKNLNIQKIYNPINMDLSPVDISVTEDIRVQYGNYFLMVGRFDKDKDQKTVIYAMKELIEKHGITQNLVFVGGGPTLEECKNIVKSLHLEKRIFFTGARYDVHNFYSAAELFIHSSPAEGLPTVLLEAMKYEVPIVATDSTPGVGEILRNNEYGIKCEVENASDMADKIINMLSDKNKMNHYRQKGKERLKDFDYNVIKERLNNILSMLR